MLSRDDLVAICPPPKPGKRARVNWDAYVSMLTSREAGILFREAQITTPLRMRHALATMVGETGLSVIWESGAYTAEGLWETFGGNRHSARLTWAECQKLADTTGDISIGPGRVAPAKTYLIFERVYGLGNPKKAKALGNTLPGDGYRFRGLGLGQMTGGFAHRATASKLGCTLDELEHPINLLKAFLHEWKEKDCNTWADKNDEVSIRKLWNGGSLKVPVSKLNGMENVRSALRRATRVITAEDMTDDDGDVPAVVEVDDRKPVALVASTEMQASSLGVMGGGYSIQDGFSVAAAKTAASGNFSFMSFAMNVMSEPQFWVGVGVVAVSLYWMVKRHTRFHMERN